MRLSFRGRLFYLFLLLFVLVGSLAGLILERTLSRRIEAAVSDQLWSLTGVARATLSQTGSSDDPLVVDPVVDSLAKEAGFMLAVVSSSGRLIGDSRLILPQLKGAPSFRQDEQILEAVETGGFRQRTLYIYERLIVSALLSVRDRSGQGVVLAPHVGRSMRCRAICATAWSESACWRLFSRRLRRLVRTSSVVCARWFAAQSAR